MGRGWMLGQRSADGRGFTLMEVMIALAVFVTAVLVLMSVYIGIASLRESNRNVVQAMADARTVLEAMRDTSTGGLAAVTGTNWATWASANGLTSLNNEVITVAYVNPAADPLDVTVQTTWQERGRNRSATVNTLMTQR